MSTQRSTVLMVGPDTGAIGGMGSVAITLAQAAERRGDFDVRLLNSGGGSGRSGWAAWPGALAVAAREPYDVMHLHVASKGSTWRKMSFAAIARSRRIPYVIHLHGGGYADFLDALPPARLSAVQQFFANAAQVVTLGDSWRALVLRRLGTSAQRTVVVGNGVEAVERDDEQPTIVHLGEVTRVKGVDVLLEAAEPLLAEHPEWRLQLVGPTPDPELVARAEEAGRRVGGRIEVLGPKFGPDKLPYLAQAGIFTLASRREALPMAMLEAMSAGLPVVMTPVGAIGEVITDGDNGRLVPAEDPDALRAALAELIRDGELRHRLGARGQQTWRERFSSDAMVDGIQRTWRAALGQPVAASAPTEAASVSVIIPTINRDSLTAAVASALAQRTDLLDVRVIVVNDSGAPLGRDLGEHVTVIDTPGRTGVSAARNRGLAAVETDFFAFLDDDDLHRAGHLQTAVDTLRASDADVYFCRAMVHYATAGERVEPAELMGARTLRDYLTGVSNWRSRSRRVITSSTVIRGIHAGHRFDESLRVSEDTWFLLTLEAQGATMVSGDGVFVDMFADARRNQQRSAENEPRPLVTRLAQLDPAQVPEYLVGRDGREAARAGDPAGVLRVAREARAAGGTARLAPALGTEFAVALALSVVKRARR